MNSLYSFLNVKYIYISVLNSSDSFVSESSFNSMFDVFKDIDVKMFLKSIRDNIRYYNVMFRVCNIDVFLECWFPK